MNIEFNSLPDTSRLWVYQCNRNLLSSEIELLSNKLESFQNNWQAHGKDLRASFEIKYDRFVIISVDESNQDATGCSIDDSVRVLQKIGVEMNIDFFDRMNILYKKNDEILSASMSEFKKLLKEGICDANTIVFDNTVTSKKNYIDNWEKNVKDSWQSRMLPKESVS